MSIVKWLSVMKDRHYSFYQTSEDSLARWTTSFHL